MSAAFDGTDFAKYAPLGALHSLSEKFSSGLPENFESMLTPDSGYSEAIDFENVEGHVDQELADSIHEEEPQAWFDEYVRLHWEKHNEIFHVN